MYIINVLIRQAYFRLVVYLTFITKRARKATIPFYSNSVKLLRKFSVHIIEFLTPF